MNFLYTTNLWQTIQNLSYNITTIVFVWWPMYDVGGTLSLAASSCMCLSRNLAGSEDESTIPIALFVSARFWRHQKFARFYETCLSCACVPNGSTRRFATTTSHQSGQKVSWHWILIHSNIAWPRTDNTTISNREQGRTLLDGSTGWGLNLD